MEFVVEPAKDGKDTCRVKLGNKWKYLYSKYKPWKSVDLGEVRQDRPCVLFGLGLGYEFQSLVQKTTQPIYVIEKHRFFQKHLQGRQEFQKYFSDPRLHFFFEKEYMQAKIPVQNCSFVRGVTASLDVSYYSLVLNHLKEQKGDEKKCVLVLKHPTIAFDCMEAFHFLGYHVLDVDPKEEGELLKEIHRVRPDFLFSINVSGAFKKASIDHSIPYLSWVVDSPAIGLYQKDLNHPCIHLFIQESVMCQDLRGHGFKNVTHMPVAVSVSRLQDLLEKEKDPASYASEVSFVGNTGAVNEFNQHGVVSKLSPKTLGEIHSLFLAQSHQENADVIQQLVDTDLLKNFEKESGLCLPEGGNLHLDRTDMLSFLLGKKYNEMERIQVIQSLSQLFETKVYGDEAWKEVKGKKLKYMGYLDHFRDMPKVFYHSKINVNITRAYVISGLPMRVFDVLGSRGFLVSNYKGDLGKLFCLGKDLLVYRDLKDLIEICEYYLVHEKEREKIAKRGFETVLEKHTFIHRIRSMMECALGMSAASLKFKP